MPIYEYEGQRYDIADTDPAVAKSKILNYLEGQKEPEVEYTPTPETGFIPSVKRGAIGLQSLVADVAPAMVGRVAEKLGVPGAGDYATAQMQEAAAKQERAQQLYPAAVPSYTDIKSGGDLYNYVIESIGELIPSMIPSILTGGAAGIAGRGAALAAEQAAKKASMEAAQKTMLSYSGSKLSQEQLVNLAKAEAVKAGQDAASKVALKYQAAGAIGGSAVQNIPEVYQNVAQETGKEDLGAALLFGGFNSVLDAITPLKLLRAAKGRGLTENELIGAWYKRAGKGVLTGFATEGATEAVQEMSSAAAEKFVDDNKQFFTEKNFERFINAGLKGGIGGGAVSGVANVAFGQKEAPTTIAPTPTTTAEEAAPVETVTPEGKLSKEEALAKVMAAAGVKPEEVADVNKPTFTPPSGASAEVSGEPGAGGTPAGTTTPGAAGVADVAGATSLIESGDGEQQRPLVGAVEEAAKPEVVAPPVVEAKPEEVKPAEIAPEAAAAVANEPPDFLDWVTSKGYSLTDGTLDWPGLEAQWKAESGVAPAAPKEVAPEIAKVAEEAAPIVEAKPPAVKKKPKKPAATYSPSETTKALVAAEKTRRASNKKPAEVINQVVETNLDVEPSARRSNTHQAGIQLAQTYRQQQTELAKEIDTDDTLSKEEKAAGKAFQNYMIVGNNNIKNALNILAADMFDGAPFNSNPYLPNVGGASAKLFYGSLNPANKKFVDDKVAFLKAQEQRLKKFSGEAKDQTKKDFDEYGESIEIKLTDKERKELNKANKAKIAENEAKAKEYNENLKKLGETVKAEGDMFGGTTPAFMAHILRGDLRSALNEIVKDTSNEFTALDKEIAKRLLSAKNLPSLVVVDKLPDNALGAYNTGEDTVYIAENALNSHIVLHEVVHGYTTTLIRAWESGEVVNKNVTDLNNLYKYLKENNPELATEYGIKEDLAEFASEVMSNRSFQDKLKAIPYQRSNVFTEFARAVLRILGISPTDKFSALASALISVDNMLGTGRQFQETTEFVKPETVKFEGKAQKGPLQPELRGIDSYEEWVGSMPEAAATPNNQTIRKAFTTVNGGKELIRLFQNERYPIKNWQDLLELAGKIVHSGDDQTNIYTQISLATGRAEDEFLVNMSEPSNRLYAAIGEYSKAKGVNEEQALKELQAIFVALHEGERRQVKYLMTVPLTADAAAQRKAILELVRSNKIDEDTARTLRTMLDDLVANNKMEKGFDDDGPSNRSTDIESDDYNVAGIRTKVIQETLATQYEPNKALIDPIREALQKIHDVTIELNKRGNYFSQPVSNIVAFYGFKNYVPFKGRPGEKVAKIDDLLNFDSEYNGREMQEAAFAFEGRVSESDNVLLQSLSDGVRAAMRAGRGGTASDGTQFGISQAVKNAINHKDKDGKPAPLLAGKRLKTIKFEDRYKVGGDDALRAKGESIFFHYNPDGSIEIYEISDKRLREAIRRTYRTSQPLLDMANNITSLLGQMHTRYNIAFAPMNFIRDTLTNAFTMGAEMGPGVVGSMASKIAQGGLSRAFKVSRLYKNGKFKEIEALAEKDPYVKAMFEYIQLGGKVAYVSGIGVQSQFEQVQANLGRKGIASTKDQVDGVIDLWTNMFEFATRTAAYQVTKDKYIRDGLSPKEAAIKAAGYVKNLANFEQVGVWGKELGSIFMFFRPSATGAVRAIEALIPIFRDVEKALASLPEVVRNDPAAVAKFRQNMEQQRRTAMAMSMSLAGIGSLVYLMSVAMAEDDEDGRNKTATDDLARWTRFARFHVPGTDIVFQIPWGFGLGAFAAAGAQVTALGTGKTSLKETLNNIKDIGFDSFLPLPMSKINMWENPAAWAMDSATPSIFRPFLEYTMNMDGLGREIYNNRQSRFGDAYTGGDSIPELYKDAARMLANITNGDIDISPNTMYFFANNYANGLTRLVHNSYNIGLVGAGEKEFNPKTDTLLFDSFFGAKSNFDARQFSKVENQIKDMERKLNMFKTDPVRYLDYISENPFDQGVVDLYNKAVNGDLKKTRELANNYRRMSDLSPKERKELLDNVKEQQNLIKRNLIEMFDAYDIKP
jgi:hypothetical protein